MNFIERLKILGVYDQSLIVLKSDHGKPASYSSSPPHSYKSNNNDMGYDGYRRMLMIKNFNQYQELPSYVNEVVLLPDLANTLCRVLDTESSCDRFAGVNLLSDQLASEDSYYIYVPINESSSFHYYLYVAMTCWVLPPLCGKDVVLRGLTAMMVLINGCVAGNCMKPGSLT